MTLMLVADLHEVLIWTGTTNLGLDTWQAIPGTVWMGPNSLAHPAAAAECLRPFYSRAPVSVLRLAIVQHRIQGRDGAVGQMLALTSSLPPQSSVFPAGFSCAAVERKQGQSKSSTNLAV